MKNFIDLTPGTRTFDVSTSVHHNGENFMGPVVRVNARDSIHALEVVRNAGYVPNIYFLPEERKG